jgi:glyoxylase-like metal-dependent hydrolase (beta-lactamase superfamily II)
MNPMPNSNARRSFLAAALRGAGATTLGAAFPWLPVTAVAQSVDRSIAEHALRGEITQFSGAGGNVVLLRDSAGGVLVDSGSADSVPQLVEHVGARLGGVPVTLLFNTHWHDDHTGGNDAFSKVGARIIAHENTRLWMSTEYYVDWQDRTYRPRAPAALPTETFYSHEPQPIAVSLGAERIEYGQLREAHTDGDVYVRFREHNVIVAGGAVAAGTYPILDYATGGWIGGLMDATKQLLDIADADTLIVPATGPAQRRAFLAAQYEMIGTVRGRVENLMRQGKSAAEMIAAGVTKEFDATFGPNSAEFVSNVYGGLWWQGRLNGSL